MLYLLLNIVDIRNEFVPNRNIEAATSAEKEISKCSLGQPEVAASTHQGRRYGARANGRAVRLIGLVSSNLTASVIFAQLRNEPNSGFPLNGCR